MPYVSIEGSMTRRIVNHPELQQEEDAVQVISISQAAQTDLMRYTHSWTLLMQQYNGAMVSFKEANESMAQISVGLF